MQILKTIYDASLFLDDRGGDAIFDIAQLDGGLCIDGGAAEGIFTQVLLKGERVSVLAFEPFPGNIPHFQSRVGNEPRVTLKQKALGSFNGRGSFYVSRVVDGKQPGWNHLKGYSSEGYLVDVGRQFKSGQLFEVDVIKLEDCISQDVTLLKLDLQGGEYDALLGAGKKIENVRYCYVEFSLDWRLIDFFHNNNFVVFDTPYTGIPKVPLESLDDLFDGITLINLSNGYVAVSGRILGMPRDRQSYRVFLEEFKKEYFHHLWSDLIAVNLNHLQSFFQTALKQRWRTHFHES